MNIRQEMIDMRETYNKFTNYGFSCFDKNIKTSGSMELRTLFQFFFKTNLENESSPDKLKQLHKEMYGLILNVFNNRENNEHNRQFCDEHLSFASHWRMLDMVCHGEIEPQKQNEQSNDSTETQKSVLIANTIFNENTKDSKAAVKEEEQRDNCVIS